MILKVQGAVEMVIAVNALVALAGAVWIYASSRKKLENQILSILSFLFGAWSAFLYLAIRAVSENTAAYYYKISFAPLVFFIPVFLHLLSIYSDKKVFTRNIITKIYLVFFLIFAAYFTMPEVFIKGACPGVYFRNVMAPSFGFGIFAAIFLCFLAAGSYYLLYSGKMYLKLLKNRRIWLFLGLAAGMLAPINVFLAAYGIRFVPLGLLGVIPGIILSRYAVAAHHTLEADIVINKTVLLAYFTLFIIAVYAGVIHVFVRVGYMEYYTSSVLAGCLVLLCLLFGVHYGGISRLDSAAEHIVYEERMRYYKFLKTIDSAEAGGTELDILLNKGVEALVNLIGIESVSVYLLDENTADYTLRASRGIESRKPAAAERIPPSSSIVQFLKKNSLFVVGENEEFARPEETGSAGKEFRKMNMKLSVPVYYTTPVYGRRELFGFLNLGSKKNNTNYSDEDIDILNAYSRRLGSCMDNYRLMMSAIRDDLTGLYRRNYFLKRLGEESERSRRYERPFSLMMADVDNFKRINDTRGHQAGDEALKKIAHVIKTGLRSTDIAARYGGEEFIILLPETENSQAVSAAERLRGNVEKEFKGSITVSIGLATYKKSQQHDVDIIREADVALYRAKTGGKNRIVRV